MKLHPTLQEYPPEWDESDFEDLYRHLIDDIAELIFLGRFDQVSKDFEHYVNHPDSLEPYFYADDFNEWIQDKRDDTQDPMYFDPRAKLNAPEVAWTYVEEMAERYGASR